MLPTFHNHSGKNSRIAARLWRAAEKVEEAEKKKKMAIDTVIPAARPFPAPLLLLLLLCVRMTWVDAYTAARTMKTGARISPVVGGVVVVGTRG
jgi:hypothetical protein